MSRARYKRGGRFVDVVSVVRHIENGGCVYIDAHTPPKARAFMEHWSIASLRQKLGNLQVAIPIERKSNDV